ncbi:MAG: hypothetical protein K8M05_27640 [Deltaproteobacteria bacterium]|nr:hypothetical protein [Kofleriaceae bacterium]
MRAPVLVAITVALLACGGSRSRHSAIERGPDDSSTGGGGGGGDTAPQPDASVAFTASNPLTCPPSFAQMGGTCDPATHPGTCTYPEGSCYCGVTMPCSGAAISDEIAAWPSSWQCTVKPPVVRPDGCPGTQPNDGASCSPSGRTCVYGSCCVWRMTCEKGRWKSAGGECPP